MMLRAGVLVAAALVAASCTSTLDEPAVVEVIREGMTAEQTAFMPQPPVCPGPVSATVREELLGRAPRVLGAYFTSPQLETDIERVNRIVTDPKGGPACLYGAGVDWVHLDSVATSGTTTVATGQVRMWSRIAQWQTRGPQMAEPHNTLNANFSLVRSGGRWLISHYDWKFAPGSEP